MCGLPSSAEQCNSIGIRIGAGKSDYRYYLYFTNEDTETYRLSTFPTISLLIGG